MFVFIKAPVYNWSPQIQGIIFASVNYGMILTLAPSGYLAGRIGTKKVVGFSLFGSTLLTLLIPLAADQGLIVLITVRVVQGLVQVSIYFINVTCIWISIWYQLCEELHFYFRDRHLGVSLQFGKDGVLHMNEVDSVPLLFQVKSLLLKLDTYVLFRVDIFRCQSFNFQQCGAVWLKW